MRARKHLSKSVSNVYNRTLSFIRILLNCRRLSHIAHLPERRHKIAHTPEAPLEARLNVEEE